MTDPTTLREQYRATKTLLWNASQMRRADQVFRLEDELDRIVATARREGIDLRAPEKFEPVEVAYSTFDRCDRIVWKRKVVRTQAAMDRLVEDAVEIRVAKEES